MPRFPPAPLPRRPILPQPTHPQSQFLPRTQPFHYTPTQCAREIRRPRRPYTFTQLIQLSDGSAFTARTTSPQSMYRSTRDTRNHPLWQPNDSSLRNVEVDEAGKLAAFRERYGRGFDLEDGGEGEADGLGDLISGYAEEGKEAREKEMRGGKAEKKKR